MSNLASAYSGLNVLDLSFEVMTASSKPLFFNFSTVIFAFKKGLIKLIF